MTVGSPNVIEIKLDRLIDDMRLLRSQMIAFDRNLKGIEACLKPSEPSESRRLLARRKDGFDFVCSRGSDRRNLALSGNLTRQRDSSLPPHQQARHQQAQPQKHRHLVHATLAV